MVAIVDIANRALGALGTRSTVSPADLAGNLSNEAIQLNLVLTSSRRQLLRMAPWNCGRKTANLVYLTSAPGTPENVTAATTLWQPGQPIPPWVYEYQYPADCIRPVRIIPATQSGYAGGVPITTAVTGGAVSYYSGPPVKYQIQTDLFYPVTAATVVSLGSGYVVNEIITLAGTPAGSVPIGAPAQIQVTSVNGSGGITGITLIQSVGNTIWSPANQTESISGSYFSIQANPVAQGSSTGAGTGATFNLTFGPQAPQRVVLTNQEFAVIDYIGDVIDPNIMDDQFQEAWAKILAAQVCMALSGDKKLANSMVQLANTIISLARVGDGNEGFTVNDVTPDWIAIRGADFANPYSSPFTDFDWGALWPMYG